MVTWNFINVLSSRREEVVETNVVLEEICIPFSSAGSESEGDADWDLSEEEEEEDETVESKGGAPGRRRQDQRASLRRGGWV